MNKFTIAMLASLAFATPALARDLYVTGTVGAYTSGFKERTVGLAVGTDINKNLRVEGAYEYSEFKKEHALYTHVMPQATIPGTVVTPYLLAGLGVELDNIDKDSGHLYVLGAGVRTEITKTIDLDFRYRRIDSVDSGNRRDVFTGGISFKF